MGEENTTVYIVNQYTHSSYSNAPLHPKTCSHMPPSFANTADSYYTRRKPSINHFTPPPKTADARVYQTSFSSLSKMA